MSVLVSVRAHGRSLENDWMNFRDLIGDKEI
jgi:hypothetical protein